MKKIFLIFALLIACSDTTYPLPAKSVAIQISDASPVQFWPVDCDTYNEKEVCGVHAKCWCHPWECTDEIKIPFTDTEENLYSLIIYDEDGNQLDSIPFENTDLNGTPYIPAIAPVTTSISLPSLAAGANLAGPDINWTTGSNPSVVLPGAVGTHNTDKLLFSYYFIEGYSYSFSVNFDNSFTRASTSMVLYVMDSANNVLTSVSNTFIANGNYTKVFTFTAPYAAVKYAIRVLNQVILFSTSASTVDINSITATQSTPLIPAVPAVPGTLYYNYASFIPSLNSPDICGQRVQLKIVTDSSPETVVLKSDCIDIQDIQKCTTLIEYSNNRNFAGLIYQDVSPEQTFNVRVPAIFFHEEFPEEDEAMDLTTGIVKTSGTIKAQRLFETDYMPYYMHRKLKLIFKHQTITIDALSWIKEEAYEIQPGDRRWPVKKAKCLLTENYIQRAVL